MLEVGRKSEMAFGCGGYPVGPAVTRREYFYHRFGIKKAVPGALPWMELFNTRLHRIEKGTLL